MAEGGDPTTMRHVPARPVRQRTVRRGGPRQREGHLSEREGEPSRGAWRRRGSRVGEWAIHVQGARVPGQAGVVPRRTRQRAAEEAETATRPSPRRGVGGARGRERAGPTRSHPEPGRDPAQRRRVLWGRLHGRRGRRGRPPPPDGGWRDALSRELRADSR